MKKLSFLLLLIPAIVLAGTGTISKKEMKQEFIKDCEKGGADIDQRYRAIFHEYCDCAGEKVVNSYSVRELEEVNRRMKSSQGSDPEMQEKLMKVIQPCLEEMQRQVTAKQ